MTTGNGKKTPKTPKSGKASASRSRRKKIVDKAPAAVDKEKMAAFFSAAGIDSSVSDSAPDSVKETAEVTVATAVESEVPAEIEAEVVKAGPGNDEELVPESESEVPSDSDGEKGEALMTTTPKASGDGSGSGSLNMLSIVFVLVVLALFWFYFISSVPLQKAAEVQVKQGKAEISALTSRVKSLETENSNLKSNLEQLKKAALKWKRASKKVSAPVTIGLLPAKKAAPHAQLAPATATKLDSSFDKAPIHFWKKMKRRGSLIQKSPENVKPKVQAPAVKVDSFSRAPKPFWLTPRRVKPTAVKVKKQVIITAPRAAKCPPCKYKKTTAKQESALNPALDPSFKKAPKPFWLKD